jgi:hypothetical protein
MAGEILAALTFVLRSAQGLKIKERELYAPVQNDMERLSSEFQMTTSRDSRVLFLCFFEIIFAFSRFVE